MFHNWLKPVTSEDFDYIQYTDYQIGSHIFAQNAALLEERQVVLIGVGAESANHVRRALYRLAMPSKKLNFADFGNVRNENPDFVIQLLKELLNGKLYPIIIGNMTAYMATQYQAHLQLKSNTDWAIIDERIRFSMDLNDADEELSVLNIVAPGSSLNVLGYQNYFTSPTVLECFENQSFEAIRIGKIRENIELAEPILRDANLLSVHLSAMRFSEASAVLHASPSGFLTEEICQLCRYAGMSDRVQSAGFYGYLHEFDRQGQSSQVVAQMIWYFLDGFANRKGDFPISNLGLMEFLVHVEDYNHTLRFWKSTKSGRWWFEITVEGSDLPRFISCTYSDYQVALQGELPERLFKAWKKYG